MKPTGFLLAVLSALLLGIGSAYGEMDSYLQPPPGTKDSTSTVFINLSIAIAALIVFLKLALSHLSDADEAGKQVVEYTAAFFWYLLLITDIAFVIWHCAPGMSTFASTDSGIIITALATVCLLEMGAGLFGYGSCNVHPTVRTIRLMVITLFFFAVFTIYLFLRTELMTDLLCERPDSPITAKHSLFQHFDAMFESLNITCAAAWTADNVSVIQGDCVFSRDLFLDFVRRVGGGYADGLN